MSQYSFEGKIISQNKIPIYNVNVFDGLSKQLTASYTEGVFQFKTNNSKLELIFSFVGYETLKVNIDLKKIKNKIFVLYEGIYLKDSINASLDELRSIDKKELIRKRRKRFSTIGEFVEG